MNKNKISKEIVDASVKIHTALGSELFESMYEAILAKKLLRSGLSIERQVAVPIRYAGLIFNEGFRADIIVEETVILGLKSVEQLSKIHYTQPFAYLKLKKLKLGYLLNFGTNLMKDGIKRMINGLDDKKLGVFGSWREPKTTNQKDA